MPMLETLENFIKLRKFKAYPQKENAVSFWAFVFSIIFYVSIFCMFDIQPSSIINTTKFWFFISNTLILIIAADFGAFSSSSEEHDVYEEYVNKTHQARTTSSFETHYMKIVEERNPKENMMIIGTEEEVQDIIVDEKAATDEVKLDILSLQTMHRAEPVGPTPLPQTKDFPVINHDVEDSSGNLYDKKKEAAPPQVNEEKKKQTKCVRSNSDKAIKVGNEETGKRIQRSKSEKYEGHEVEEESSEFSTMSIEELNRRVEEFIRRSNRQIRLEAALETSGSFKSSVYI